MKELEIYLKRNNYYVQAMIEEEELSVAPEQESVDTFVKESTLAMMKADIMMQMKRVRFKANAMSKQEYEEKQNMLKARLISIDNQDLDGVSFERLREFEDKLGLLPVDEETKRHGMEATYQERVRAFEEDFEEKNQKAEDFVRKMSAERKERLKHKRDERKREKIQKLQREEREKEKEEHDEAEKAQMRIQLEEEIRERMKDHERHRQEMKEKWEHDRREIAKKKYKHQELEERYQKKVIIPSLERKKEELRKKREFFAPIRHKDLVEHEKVYVERLKEKLKEKKKKREKWYKDIGYGDYDPSKYHSKYLSSVENEKNEPLIDPQVFVVQKCDKQRNYAKFVKEMHKPKISIKKKKEMKQIIKLVENSGMSRQLEVNRNKSMEMLRKERQKNEKPHYENYIHQRKNAHSQSVMKNQKKRWKYDNPMIPREPLRRKGYMVDYLLKKRIKRQQMELDDPEYRVNRKINWDKLAGAHTKNNRSLSNAYEDSHSTIPAPKSRFDKDVYKSEDQILRNKLDIIKAKAKQIEEEAIEKERNMKLTTGTNVKASNEINGLLIDSIEAKLHLLKDI